MNAGQDRRADILLASARLFAGVGFAATTVRSIAEVCAVSPSTLFHHYASKRELLVDVVAEGTLRAHALVQAGLADVTGPRDRLRRLVGCHLRALHGDARPFMVVATTEFRHLDDAERKRVVATRDAYEAVWHGVLAEAAAAGVVAADPLLRLFLLGAVNHTIAWYDPDSELSVDALADRFVALVADGAGEERSP